MARRDLTQAPLSAEDGYARPEVYITTTENAWYFGIDAPAGYPREPPISLRASLPGPGRGTPSRPGPDGSVLAQFVLLMVSLARKSILLWYHVSARQNEIFGAIENCLLTQNHIFQVGQI